ncbi:MAG: LysR family transcriptional regulator [Ramlibacter sp.]|uniref:LysR family transcriptional regulator n=1 Tax=Ramlibacter sp. TaxID=1917967 RepID=UPI002620215E|nr:LysR family transcriptional regulator [Ramlibacter sp.]MDB5751829.1 LysR family transcriptional regulator [Ramlibacter sp.]
MSSIRILRTFSAVAAEGSFAATAARVALTQAAVGQQMRVLEAELRRPLFERQGKAVVLNEAGRALVPQVRRLLGLYDQMLAPGAGSHAMAGTVHLGAVVSAVRPLIQATLTLKARHPALDLHVSAAKSIELVERVQAGELDAAVVVREAGSARPQLAWTPLYSEAMVLLLPRKLQEAPLRTLLQAQPFIRFDPSQHTGRLVERTLKRLRARPQELLELNALETMVDLVRSGLGITLVPLLRDARWQADTKLRVLEIPQAEERRMALVQRRDSGKGALLAAVAREFQGKLP